MIYLHVIKNPVSIRENAFQLEEVCIIIHLDDHQFALPCTECVEVFLHHSLIKLKYKHNAFMSW